MTEVSNDPFLNYILSSKQLANLDRLRRKAVSKQLELSADNKNPEEFLKYQNMYRTKAFECLQNKHDTHKIMESQYESYQRNSKTRRYSVDLDSVHAADTNPQDSNLNEDFLDRNEDDEAVMELRKRLLGKQQNKVGYEPTKSVDRQIEDQDNLQQDLIQDMSKLVGSLKQGAVAFQSALEEDKQVLGAAEIGIQVASQGLMDVSGKLRKYDKSKLGYLFYITVFIFMILGLVFTFIIIQLFPAL
ncbi:use1p [Saccharomyces arboricola H-6]|uniref:Use1p n=1 Tax=Saccharomyces arboricola (strain H-6 / AS 2.3317 / CBS 10644) TaxID=1160507 RepID=J8Q540_SACAR|nr:use1p [Saccharomyces arboricola H-6]